MNNERKIIEACAASALDFIDTILFRMKEDKFDDETIESFKEYLFDAHEMHYNTDIGEQGEHIERYLDEHDSKEELTLLQNEGNRIENWLKEAGYTDECIDAGFEPIEGHQGRVMSFKYNENNVELDGLDIDRIATSIDESVVIDDRLSIRVFKHNEEEYRNIFCVEIWLNS